jgi:small subunit ribosomal protein S9
MTEKKSRKNRTIAGKKKMAVARASIRQGKGSVRINSVPLNNWGSSISRLVVQEPLLILDNIAKSVDIDVNVNGGGVMGQAAACRVAIARALVNFSKDEKTRKLLMEYDDKILSGDSRQKEPCKPNRSAPRSRRQKSYR